MRLLVKNFMSARVTTAAGETTVQEIRALMKKDGIHAIPIVSYDKGGPTAEMTIRGIVTASDISKNVHHGAPMENVMTSSSVHVVSVFVPLARCGAADNKNRLAERYRRLHRGPGRARCSPTAAFGHQGPSIGIRRRSAGRSGCCWCRQNRSCCSSPGSGRHCLSVR